MSKLKRHASIVCCIMLVAIMTVMPALTGCSGGSGDPKPQEPETQCTVTFDKNTSHATNTIQPQTVENGKTVKQPQVFVTDADETNRFTVTGWYTSKDCKEDEKWDFADPVTKSMTLYAAWQEKVKVEFYLGASATTASSVQWIVKGEKAEREDGLVGFYKLEGYFTDTEFKKEFDFNSGVTADQKLYLKYDASVAYLNVNYLSAMTFGYDKHFTYESKYCPVHRVEVTGEACTESGCTAELVDPASVTTKYCPDCEQDVEESAIEEGKHKGCTAELGEGVEQAAVKDIAGPIADKQRPAGFYTASVTKATQAATEEEEAFDYARLDFGNLEQPYVWYNPLNIDITGKSQLTITYRNVGKGKAIRFYYVVGYRRADGQYDYSGNGVFANFVDIEIGAADGEWHTATVDMGKETVSKIDGISEWGTADLLSIFRIDYPYGAYSANEYKSDLVKPGDSILDVAEIKFSENGIDYSAKDTLDFGADSGYSEGAPEDENWVWSVEEGAELYNQGGTPTAFFPYEATANTLTATATESNAIDCDSDDYKALTIIYNNHGYGTSAKLTWKTTAGEGSKNVSLDARANGKTIYFNMAGEDTWTGTLESLALTYTKKGVDNAITVNSITINAPKPEDVAGFSFKYGKSGFSGAYNAEKASMVVDSTGISKTAESGKTVLDVNNAVVYKGFTVWYTQGATAATKLTLTYTDESDNEHSAEATLASGTGEKSVSFTFVDETSGRSAMSGKIKDITLATDAGSVFVTYVDFDFDTAPFFVMTEQGAPDSNWASVISTRAVWAGGCEWVFDSVKNAWRVGYVAGALPQSNFGLTTVPVSQLKEKKMYLVLNNTTDGNAFNVYAWFTGSAGAGVSPQGFAQPTLAADQRNMGEYAWTVVEVNLTGQGAVGDNFDDIYANSAITDLLGISISFANPTVAGNVYLRAVIFR